MTQTDQALTIRRTFPFSRARVYAAWTQPEHLARWMGPHGYSIKTAESDPRVGGPFYIEMVSPAGEVLAIRGVYREIREPAFLRYTFTWVEDSPEDELETLVTVRFDERAGSTELTLTHEHLRNAESVERHGGGWSEAIEKFAAYLASHNA